MKFVTYLRVSTERQGQSGLGLEAQRGIEGSLSFPDGFKPLRVVVDIQQKGYKNSTIQKIFDWPASAG